MKKPSVLDDYLSEPKLAQQLSRDVRTLKRWRSEGRGPPVTWIGKTPFFKIESVREWLESREKRMPRERGNHRRTH